MGGLTLSRPLRAAFLGAGLMALAACSAHEPGPKALAGHPSLHEDAEVGLDGADSAARHGRDADTVVDGFELEGAAPAAAEAPAPAPAADQGFEMLAAAPQTAPADNAVAYAAPEPETAAAAPAALPAPVAAPRVHRQPRAAAKPPAARAMVLSAHPIPAAPAVQAEAAAPEPPIDPAGRALMFGLCVLAAGALWRWHKHCLKAVTPVRSATLTSPLVQIESNAA